MNIMQNLETIVEIVMRLEANAKENFDTINKKIDNIIERNSDADVIINTIKVNQENHDKNDQSMFTEIKTKHTGYDKFIRGVLIFLILELIGISLVLAHLK